MVGMTPLNVGFRSVIYAPHHIMFVPSTFRIDREPKRSI
jgi:hypothetical protein